MALYTRETLPTLLAKEADALSQVILLFGERYLCGTAARQIEAILLRRGGNVYAIDGDQEDIQRSLNRMRTFSLLPGLQVYRVRDTRLFHSRQVAKSIWERAVRARKAGKEDQVRRALRAFLASGGLPPSEGDLDSLSEAEWQQCFGFSRPGGELGWTRTLLADAAQQDQGAPPDAADAADLLVQALHAGLPAKNVLLLITEEVDQRKKLFKTLKEEQTVIDLRVESGSGAKARKEQQAVLREIVRQTLAEGQKTLEPGLAELLFDRVGFHPVALVMELRKVMLFVGERRQITRGDVDLLIGRTRQEALFELTAALGRRDLQETLRIAAHLQEDGIHPLAIVAALRNFARGLLLCRALLEQPDTGFQPAMSAAAFQQQCLPKLKERGQWKKELSGHPFALYMQFKTAGQYSLALLAGWLRLLLAAEYRLKGSAVEPPIILHHLFLSMLSPVVP